MNPRIKELVEQAGFQMTEKNGQALAEFADLIVRECADILNDNVSRRVPASEYCNLIKKHFGLQE